MNDRYTPGPWAMSRDAVPDWHTQITIYAEADGRRVATAFETPANARLIAKAPELLKIVTGIVHDGDPFYDDPDEGPFCRFCYVNGRSKPHEGDCAWLLSRALLSEIEGDK